MYPLTPGQLTTTKIRWPVRPHPWSDCRTYHFQAPPRKTALPVPHRLPLRTLELSSSRIIDSFKRATIKRLRSYAIDKVFYVPEPGKIYLLANDLGSAVQMDYVNTKIGSAVWSPAVKTTSEVLTRPLNIKLRVQEPLGNFCAVIAVEMASSARSGPNCS